MSQADLWTVVGRARADNEFLVELIRDFPGTLRKYGYALDPEQIAQAQNAIQYGQGSPGSAPMPTQISANINFELDKMRERSAAQVDRLIDLGKFTVQILKETLNNAKDTYRAITRMNLVMFCMGVALFLFAAVEGAINHNLAYTAAFAGLGAASFVALFFLGPIDKTQTALSNLIQAEIAFMTYFEQISFCENYGLAASEETGRIDPERVERASELLQKRSLETVEMLQKYLEVPDKNSQAANGSGAKPQKGLGRLLGRGRRASRTAADPAKRAETSQS